MPTEAQSVVRPTTASPSYYRARYYDASIGRFQTEDKARKPAITTLYGYVENNPLIFVDPSGLVARLYCEPISREGRNWYERLGLIVSGAVHCYLYVSCHGSGHYLELYGPGPGDPMHGRPHNDQHLNLGRAGRSTEYPLTPPAGLGCCEFEDRLDRAFNNQASDVPVYNRLGPNSNTFVHAIIQQVGGSASPPFTAFGWDWTPSAQ
jgi:RHS repeat-associated protein